MQPGPRQAALSRQKDAVVLGTYESNAFILSLRDKDEFATTHSFGYHRVPHIGVYGADYTLALPMVLLSLPATPRYLQKLPTDLLNALDLSHLTGSLPLPPSPLNLLSQRIISTLHSHKHLPQDTLFRAIARELVEFSLTSALTKLGLAIRSPPGHYSSAHTRQSYASSWLKYPQPSFEGMEQASFQEYRGEKRPSVMSIGSVSPTDNEEQGAHALDNCGLLKRVSIKLEGVEIEAEEDEFKVEGTQWGGEDSLRLAAKKIVKKALHLACKRWESMNRRSSIDYLTASTKRLKIASPSPPPTLQEAALYEHGVAASGSSPVGGAESSLTLGAGCGMKRNRSESHDVMMMKELERFREMQVMLGQQEEGERVIAKPRRTAGGEKDGASGFKRGSSPFLLPRESMGSLISNIHRLSIAEMQSESEECCSSEEDYTVLSAVTKSTRAGSESEVVSPVPPPNSPTTLLHTHRGRPTNRGHSPLLQKELPSALLHIHPRESYGDSLVEEELATCTSPEFQEKLSAAPTASLQEMMAATASSLSATNRSGYLLFAGDSAIPKMDYYVILHTHPPPGLCQKFLCNNSDEVNLMYHCWLYPDVACSPTVVCSQPLPMGVFQTCGVAPVHQDLQDAGVAFHHLQPRTVCIHSCHFSPENAQLQLLPKQQVHSFFSAARDGERRVVALHVVPGSTEVEEALRQSLAKCSTLGELLEQLSVTGPETVEMVRTIALP